MKQYLLGLVVTIGSLVFSQIDPSIAKPPATIQPSPPAQKAVDLKQAIGQFFKAGKLEKSWFAPADPPEPEKFIEFRKQALDSRNFILKLYGAYQNVRVESGSKYVAVFERKELGIEFTLDKQGRIAGISAK